MDDDFEDVEGEEVLIPRLPSNFSITEKEKETIKSAEKNILAGGIAGSLGKTVTAPLSRITVLYQVSPLLHKEKSGFNGEDSLFKSFRNIIRKQGTISLWKGNFTAVVHRFPFSAINFAVFEGIQSHLLSPTSLLGRERAAVYDSPGLKVFCGGMAGAVSCFVCYPLDLVRIRLTVGNEASNPPPPASISSSSSLSSQSKGPRLTSKIMSTAVEIIEKDGFRGLYRGLTASLLVQVPTYALSFSVYGQAKETLLRTNYSIFRDKQHPGHLSAIGSLASGSISGMISALILFPLDIIRKRMQVTGSSTVSAISVPSTTSSSSTPIIQSTVNYGMHSNAPFASSSFSLPASPLRQLYPTRSRQEVTIKPQFREGAKGLIDHGRAILAQDGIKGFYRGILPEILKVCPMVAVTFCSFETVKDTLDDYFP
jgi:hypothetical protein